MKVTFWVRKSQITKKDECPIMVRIYFNQTDRVDFAIGFTIKPIDWDENLKKVKKSNTKCESINKQLNTTEFKLNQIYANLSVRYEIITAEIVRNRFLGIDGPRKKKLVEAVEEFIEDFYNKVGRITGYSYINYKKYCYFRDRLKCFLKDNFKRQDIYLEELDEAFAESFRDFLISKYKLDVNSVATNYYGKLRKIIDTCVKKGAKRGYIDRFPFGEFIIKRHIKEKIKLNYEEVISILNKRFKSERMERVRDRTICGIFTGAAYADLEKLTINNIEVDITGNRYIRYRRSKSDKEAIVPIYPEVDAIFAKYLPTAAERGGKILPSISNQKLNEYLKELADLCGIQKDISSHTLRHTFAQLQIDSGTSSDATAKMLGHANTKITMSTYAQTGKTRVLLEKDNLTNALESVYKKKII